MQQLLAEPHLLQSVRYNTRRRSLVVAEITALSPKMRRIILHSPELSDFESLGVDDHIKLFFPDGTGETVMRDYTPRAFDRSKALLTIDFALHENGPATSWARHAKVGDMLDIGGPRGSKIMADDFDWYLLIADESGLPSIGRRLEELRARVPVTTIVAIDTMAEAQEITTSADWTPRWVCRGVDPKPDLALLLAEAENFTPPPGDGYIWVAAEAAVAKALRQYFLEGRKQNPHWMRASGYWLRGETGAHENFD